MDAEPTLDDNRAGALSRDELPSAGEQVAADAVSFCGQRAVYDQQVANRAMLACGHTLAATLAPLLHSGADEVFNALGHMPDAMLELLTSPQGWSTLAGEVAAALGRPAPTYITTIH